ncbi:MAG: hypothetical protein AAFY58_08700, partial [Planctomycetota bacterium]
MLSGRKVRDPGDNRTNIYLLGLSHSSGGKDWPLKINTQVLRRVGLANSLGEQLASGEGIQDALFTTPAMLFQTDEIDTLLQSMKRARDARYESIMATLLTMYSSSNSVYPMRRRANNPEPGVIDQPCLVLFGTAIPNHYYAALSERMLTNGLFARMIVLESGRRPPGLDAAAPGAIWGAAQEASAGKDTITGHWELAGVPLSEDWHYFPPEEPTFPAALIARLIEAGALPGVLGDRHASGTAIIEALGGTAPRFAHHSLL